MDWAADGRDYVGNDRKGREASVGGEGASTRGPRLCATANWICRIILILSVKCTTNCTNTDRDLYGDNKTVS